MPSGTPITDSSKFIASELIERVGETLANFPESRSLAIAFCCLEDEEVVGKIGHELVNKLKVEIVKKSETNSPLSADEGKELFRKALSETEKYQDRTGTTGVVNSIGLLLAILSSSQESGPIFEARSFLEQMGLTVEQLQVNQKRPGRRPKYILFEPLGYGNDLTEMAALDAWDGCPVIGMEHQVKQIERRLEIKSACLLGEPGVGKSAIVKGFAWYIKNPTSRADGTPLPGENAQSWKVIAISRDEILSQVTSKRRLESVVKDMISFFRDTSNVVPFFDEVHTILSSSDSIGEKIANLLKPAMAEGHFKCIAATTLAEFQRFIYPDNALKSRFGIPVRISEPDEQTCYQILSGIKNPLIAKVAGAKEEGIYFADNTYEEAVKKDDAILKAIRITDRYLKSDRLPRKAIDFFQELVVFKRERIAVAKTQGRDESAEVSSQFALEYASEHSPFNVRPETPGFWTELIREFSENNEPLAGTFKEIVKEVLVQWKGWCAPRGQAPLGRILLLGSPDSAAAIVQGFLNAFHGDSAAKVEEDLQQYSDSNAIVSLTGARPGYIGFSSGNNLFDRLRRRLNSGGVLLLNNASQAHPDIMPVLTSLLRGTARHPDGGLIDTSNWILFLNDSTPQSDVRQRYGSDLCSQIDQVVELPDVEVVQQLEEDPNQILRQWKLDGQKDVPAMSEDDIKSIEVIAASKKISIELATQEHLKNVAMKTLLMGESA